MKGYVARIVNRAKGSMGAGALRPARTPLWQSPAADGSPFIPSSQLSAQSWPDQFDGNPVQMEQPRKQAGMPVESPSGIAEGHSVLNPVPPVPPAAEPLAPTRLEPTATPVEGPSAVPIQPRIEPKSPEPPTSLQNEGPATLNPAQPEPPQVVQGNQLQTPRYPVPPTGQQPTGFPNTPRVVHSSEGFLSSAIPSLQPSVKQLHNEPVEGTKENPKALTPTPPPSIPAPPKERPADALRPLQSPPLQPQRPTAQLLPPTAPPRAPMQAPPKQGLVIGKITVEVVEAAKPPVVVQAPPTVRAAAPAARKSSSRPENNLKYGLGQL